MISSMMISLASIWLLQIPFALYIPKYTEYGIRGVYSSSLFSAIIIGIFIFFYLRYKKWENTKLIDHKNKEEKELQKEIEEEMMVDIAR